MATPLGAVGVIKRFFDKEPHRRPVTLAEFQALNTQERLEIARKCAPELGLAETDDKKFVPK